MNTAIATGAIRCHFTRVGSAHRPPMCRTRVPRVTSGLVRRRSSQGAMVHNANTVLVLSWHPQSGHTTAGGFRRAVEIVDRWPASAQVVVVDAAPGMFSGAGLHVVSYPLPALTSLDGRSREMARAIQWSLAAAMLTVLGLWHGRRRRARVVYTATSELFPCIVSAFVVSRVL